ncbi:MAG: redoxin family protein [Puniceicoccales bacterium]|jgi:nucleoredoxin|nr:redoxin family protein [Puniceicoccales bacterium]
MKKIYFVAFLTVVLALGFAFYVNIKSTKAEETQSGPHKELIGMLKDSLFQLGGKPDAKALGKKKYVFVYFSASWCSPCRAFTPKLVEFYNENKKNGDFEILFVSRDKDAEEMEAYVKEDKMPWISVTHGSEAAKAIEKKYAGFGIPCLVLLNEKDEAIASSYGKNNGYQGPGVALEKYKELKKAEK